jgi:alpha-mannosidase
MTNNSSAIISESIAKLRQLTQVDVQCYWQYVLGVEVGDSLLPVANPPRSPLKGGSLLPTTLGASNWQIVQLNDKGYITWSAGRQVCWLQQKIIIPDNLHGYPLTGFSLRLVLSWWAEDTKIFVNNNLVQEGDLFDSSSRILLTPSASLGDQIIVTLRLVSPGHDIGALMQSKCVYERNNLIDPGFVADELTVLHNYLVAFEPNQIDILAATIQQIDWDNLGNAGTFETSLLKAREILKPLAANLKQRSLNLLGHAHLDLAWLWTVKETWEVAQKTFTSVLNLQQDFPELKFCHTSPVLYAWIEKHRPDLFKAIQEAVKAKSWEILGGMWVEPDANLPSGESLIRQLLYGQLYNKEKFGEITKVAWLPDSFGFCWQLPQILKRSGIEYFVTGKLHWNDTTKFPFGFFWWEAPDGSKLLTLISPPNVAGVMDTNPIIMTNYAIDWERQTGLKEAFWLPGVGDHGGGPTRDMLEVQRRWQKSPFFPQLKFTKAIDYLAEITGKYRPDNRELEIPIYRDELYLEFHRGCYTTHGEQKAGNRRCEDLLYQAELWASLATIIKGQETCPYPKQDLEAVWKKVLFNQFHDILPGTSIEGVFTEANQTWQEVAQLAARILQKSLQTIAAQIILPPPPQPQAKPILIFNSLNWNRSEVVVCSVAPGNWQIFDLEGEIIPSQISKNNQLIFLAKDIPSVGYRLFWLGKNQNKPEEHQNSTSPSDFILENSQLRVNVNPETGNLSSIFDKINQREILKDAGNQLQAFQDRGQYWDAWNINPNYAEHPLAPPQLKSIEYLEKGPIQGRIRVIRQIANSEFCQDYILQIDLPILKIATTVNWQEEYTLVKAAFPLNLDSNYATYEIPCAAIQRPTRPQTPAEKAKWEVPALRWADLSDNSQNYGVSLLNDCKYGYDSQPDCLRLTLLRSPRWPDPSTDRGFHHFTYAIYPHGGSWQTGKTVHRGYELNIPLKVLFLDEIERKDASSLPSHRQFFHLPAENLILMAFKQSEEDSQAWILRCYECQGEVAEVSLKNELGLAIAHPVDLLEQTEEGIANIAPWKIVSFKLKAES